MKKFDVVSVGTTLRDVMYYTDQSCVVKNPVNDPTMEKLICVEYGAKVQSDKVFFEYGGGAMNTSVNFAGLGLKTGILATTGSDLEGKGIVEHLKSKKVDTALVQTTKKDRTGFSFLVVDENSGEHAAYVYYGAAGELNVTKKTLAKHPSKWYYVSSLYATKWRDALRALGDTGARISWNPGSKQLRAGYTGLKKFFPNTTILIVNKDEATELILSKPGTKKAGTIKQMLREMYSWGPERVIITNSRKGVHVYDGDKEYFSKAPDDRPKDTTGAGDCYGSSFTTGFIRYNGNVDKSMRLAQTNATALVHTIGANNGLLKWKGLPANLKKVK